jgi:hypothetical protein
VELQLEKRRGHGREEKAPQDKGAQAGSKAPSIFQSEGRGSPVFPNHRKSPPRPAWVRAEKKSRAPQEGVSKRANNKGEHGEKAKASSDLNHLLRGTLRFERMSLWRGEQLLDGLSKPSTKPGNYARKNFEIFDLEWFREKPKDHFAWSFSAFSASRPSD